MEINKLRKEIDRLYDDIIRLLGKRKGLVYKIGKEYNLKEEYIKNIYQIIFSNSIKEQKDDI